MRTVVSHVVEVECCRRHVHCNISAFSTQQRCNSPSVFQASAGRARPTAAANVAARILRIRIDLYSSKTKSINEREGKQEREREQNPRIKAFLVASA